MFYRGKWIFFFFIHVVRPSIFRSAIFKFPFTVANKDVYYPDFTLTSVNVENDMQCMMQCYVNAMCSAINIGPIDSNGVKDCEMKSKAITLSKWTEDKPGYTYYHIGKKTIFQN